MKKIFLGITIIILLFSSKVYASSLTFNDCTTSQSSDNWSWQKNSDGVCEFDMNNLIIQEKLNGGAILDFGSNNVVIKVSGTNEIYNTSTNISGIGIGITSKGSITFIGDGTLAVTAGTGVVSSSNIFVKLTGALAFSGTYNNALKANYLSIQNGTLALESYNNTLYTTGTNGVKLSGGSLQVISYGVWGNGQVSVNSNYQIYTGDTLDNLTKVSSIKSDDTKKQKLVISVKTYNINYNNNGHGSDYGTLEYKYTDSVSLKTNSAKGYTFKGWYTTKEAADKLDSSKLYSKITKSDITLYAGWIANTYTIKFNSNTGSGSMSSIKATYDKAVTLTSNAYKKDGYKFMSWNTKADGSGKTYKNSASVKNLATSGTLTLYAIWGQKVKVNFNSNGGTNITSKTVYKGYKYGTLNEPTKAGYTFTGWYLDSKLTNKVDSTSVVGLSKEHTLYAAWSKIKYTITYNLNGGTNNSNNPNVFYVTSATKTLLSPTRVGYTFAGWYKESTYKTKVIEIKTGSTGNVVLYAKWTMNKYNVAFNGNGATSGSMENMTGLKYTESYNLTVNAYKKKGFSFIGWNTKIDGTGTLINNKGEVSKLSKYNNKTITLYAMWKQNIYIITYELNGGINNSQNPSNYTYGMSFDLYNPTRTGYTFAGWYLDSEYTKQITEFTSTMSGSKTLYAKWTENSYNIIFDGNGATSGATTAIKNLKYTKSCTLSKNSFVKNGYIFKEWNTKADGSGKTYASESSVKKLTSVNGKNVKLYAIWQMTTEEIIYNRIMALKEEYPEGTSWDSSKTYSSIKGGFTYSSGCAAFAMMVSDKVFDTLAKKYSTTTYDDIKIGDILHVEYDSHYVVVLTKTDDYITVVEGNYSGKVKWGRKITKSTLEKDGYLTNRITKW